MKAAAKPDHVVIASRLYPPEAAAAAFRLRALARSLADAGCTVDVLTTRPPAAAGPPEDDARVRVRRWRVLRDASGAVRGYLQYLSFDVPLFLRLLLGRRPSVIVCEPPPTTGLAVLAASALLRIPYVYFAADLWSEGAVAAGAPSFVVRLLRRVESLVMRRAALVLSVSEDVSELLPGFGVPDERVRVVGNGIDTETFTLDGPAEAGPPYAIYTGTMSEWQGADVFVRGFAQALPDLPADARLVFFGQGSGEPRVRELASALPPGRVSFHGIVPPREAARWLRGARVALVSLHPDAGYDFGRPTKMYAATACGTPVIFAGRGAAAAVIRRGNLGDVVEHDAAAVAAALVRRLTTPRDPAVEKDLVRWTVENASLARVGALGAEAVLAAARRTS